MPAPPTPVVPPIALYLVPPVPVPPAPITPPVAPPPFFGQAYPPGGWALMPNYALALAQPYPIGYPPAQWPLYQQYYAGSRVILMKILKLPDLTSSLVRTHQSYIPSSSAASWLLRADPTSLPPTTSGCHTPLPTSPTLLCSGGNPPWSHTPNHLLWQVC